MNVNELRAMRAKAWEAAKNFLDSHRGETGILSDEDTKTYEEMEAKIVNLGKEIERQERILKHSGNGRLSCILLVSA